MAPSDKYDRILLKVIGGLAAKYITLVHYTSRIIPEPDDFAAQIRDNHPLILAVWHGQFMMIPKLNVDNLPTQIVVARHDDAEIIGQAFACFGVELIRGAGAGPRKRDRGGAQALRLAVKALRGGYSLSMTADVPPGPARKVGPGLIMLARLSGRPIIPAAIATNRYLSFRTWSRLTVNLPFSKMGLVLGEPIMVPRNASAQDLEALRLKAEQALDEVTARAYHLAGGNPARSMPPRHMAARHGDKLRNGLALNAYGRLTSMARPLAPLILGYRERQNKEDPARRPERYGIASMPRPDGPLIWLHAASIGELNAILPLVETLFRKRPDLNALITTGTVTSAKLASARLGARAIHQYVPLDAAQFVKRFLQHWQPDLAVFTESEIWPNLILQSAARKIPLVLVNARMSPKSFTKWRRNAGMATPLFSSFDLILAQNEKFSRRFSNLGAAHCSAVGNLKIDAPAPPADDEMLTSLRTAAAGRKVWIAASTHEGEDEIIAKAHEILCRDDSRPLTVIAPRHPDRAGTIEDMATARGLKLARRSKGQPITGDTDIYLADSIGEMGTLYRFASVAFLGGSLIAHGGQNPMEAIRCATVVLTGPHWHNFRDEYKLLLEQNAAAEIADATSLAEALSQLLNDDGELARRRKAGTEALEQLTGALGRTVDRLLPLLPPAPDDNDGQQTGDASGDNTGAPGDDGDHHDQPSQDDRDRDQRDFMRAS